MKSHELRNLYTPVLSNRVLFYFFRITWYLYIGSDSMSRNIEDSLNTAFASARMEGFEITPKIEADCRLLVSGELSIQEYIRQVAEANTNRTRSVEHGVQS